MSLLPASGISRGILKSVLGRSYYDDIFFLCYPIYLRAIDTVRGHLQSYLLQLIKSSFGCIGLNVMISEPSLLPMRSATKWSPAQPAVDEHSD